MLGVGRLRLDWLPYLMLLVFGGWVGPTFLSGQLGHVTLGGCYLCMVAPTGPSRLPFERFLLGDQFLVAQCGLFIANLKGRTLKVNCTDLALGLGIETLVFCLP